MYPNSINPYWWAASPNIIHDQVQIPRIDVGGIYKLSTNAVALTDETVDYGINPCLYRQLPCESIVLLTIHADSPTGGDALPVTIVVPNSGGSTVTTEGTTTQGNTKVGVVDSQGTSVTGANVQGNTQRLVYINKSTGVIRLLEFTNA